MAESRLDQSIKVLAVFGAIASFLWGVWTWRSQAETDLAHRQVEARKQAESQLLESTRRKEEADQLNQSRQLEATKPFHEKQLALYMEACIVSAKIATSSDQKEVDKSTQRFWELYWGELALVENKEVETKMVELGKGISRKANQGELQQLALALSHACRRSLDKAWGIHVWTNPDGSLNSEDVVTGAIPSSAQK